MLLKDQLQVQFGKQSVFATAVPPAIKMMDVTNIDLDPAVGAKIVRTMTGSASPPNKVVPAKIRPVGRIDMLPSYEDINYLLQMFFGTVNPTGAGPYVRAGSAWTTTPPTPYIPTIAYGNGSDVYRMAGAMLRTLAIAIDPDNDNNAWTIGGDLYGHDTAGGSLAALSDRPTTPILVSDTTLFIDTWAGTIGTTAYTSAFSASFALDTRRDTLGYIGSGLYAGNYREASWAPEANQLTLRLEYNSTSKAYIDALIAGGAQQKQVRVKAQSGTNIQQIDFAGTIVSMGKLWNEDKGVLSLEAVMQGTLHSTLANWFLYSNTSGVAGALI